MNARHAAALALGLVLVSPAAADPPRPLDPAEKTILNIRLSAAVLATFREQGGKLPEPHSRLVRLDSLGSAFGSELRRELAARDGWDRALVIDIIDGETFGLISFGADGEADMAYDKPAEAVLALAEEDDAGATPPGCDIAFYSGEFIRRPHAAVPPGKRAVADLEVIALAIDSFYDDHEGLPGPTCGLEVIDILAGSLEPTYLRTLPREDPWGRPYLIWTDGDFYLLVSTGADGLLDREYADVDSVLAELKKPEPTTDESLDIVSLEGVLFRWPEIAGE